MIISLDETDLAKLPADVRSAILRLVTATTNTNAAGAASAVPSGDNGWFPLPAALAPKFLREVSPKSKTVLRLLAEGNGRVKWTTIAAATDYQDWQDLAGFLAGMNRRLRKFVDNGDARLVDWDQTEDEYNEQQEWADRQLRVHPETAKTLRRYFRLD